VNDSIPSYEVAVLGATGRVGQEYLGILKDHPWFKVAEVTGNTKIGQKLGDVVEIELPSSLSSLEIKESDPSKIESHLVFSPLPTDIARQVESNFANAGFGVITDASPHRMDPDVPLMIPEVNPEHLGMLSKKKKGFIVATPNCTTIGLAITLKPLHDAYNVSKVVMTSFQALSGAGYPGVPSLDIEDNVIPFIEGEEEKVAKETNKLLGKYDENNGTINPSSIEIYCSCNRVAVVDGHLESVYLEAKETMSDPESVLSNFRSIPQKLKLPSAPEKPIVVMKEKNRPQPRLDRMTGNGMSTVVGRIRQDDSRKVLQYHLLTHNTIRGAAGGAILTAELLCKTSEEII